MGQTDESTAVLEALALVKRFGTRRVLDEVTLRVNARQVVMVVGEKGAGKRTLARAIAGEISVDGGRIVCCGTDVTKAGQKGRLAAGIALPDPQRPVGGRLWRWLRGGRGKTVREAMLANLKARPFSRHLGRKRTRVESHERSDQVLEQFGLSRLQNHPLSALSAGERSRALIASYLVCEPSLLVLDQPCKGVDPVTAGSLCSLFRYFADEGTSVLATDGNFAGEGLRGADWVYLLDAGRIAAGGSSREM